MDKRQLLLISLAGILVTGPVIGDDRTKSAKQNDKMAAPKYPPFQTVTKDFASETGFFNVYADKKKTKTLIEIPAAKINKPFLIATSIAGGNTYTGWQWGDRLVYWKVQGKKLLLIEKNTRFRGKKGTPIGESVKLTYTDQLVLTMPIKTKSTKGGYIVDGNRLFASWAFKHFGRFAAGLDTSLAVFDKLKTFPNNTEVAVTMPERGGGSFITLHYSLRDLGRSKYKPREADDRIGYFLTVAKDFNTGPKDDGRFLRYINRWDLQKLDPKLKVSPVKNPIIFYLEKTIPVPYRKYVAEGILEWNKAFEKLGFLDAVQIRQQTATNEFKDFDPEDARYNFFRWITSGRAFAMGPSRVNPLTGEILDADIIFDDAYLSYRAVEHERYVKTAQRFAKGQFKDEDVFFNPRVSSAPDAPKAKLSPFQKELASAVRDRMKSCDSLCLYKHEQFSELLFNELAAEGKDKGPKKASVEYLGKILRLTVMHEVGHTLGLRHNYVASTYKTLEEINGKDKPLVTSGSCMDYNSLNVALPGQTQGEYMSGGIGPYDYWAVAYGYSAAGDAKALKAITDQVAKAGLSFATDQDAGGADPYVNRWDLGREPLNFAKTRVKLAEHLLKDIEKRALEQGASYAKLRAGFATILGQISRSGYLSARYVGGVRIHRDHLGDPNARDPLVPVETAKQRDALKFVVETLLSDKLYQFSPKLLRQLGASKWRHWGTRGGGFEVALSDRVLAIQNETLDTLLSNARQKRVLDTEYQAGEKDDVLTLAELYSTLVGSIFAEINVEPKNASTRKPHISLIRRNLQRSLLKRLIDLTTDDQVSAPKTARALGRLHLKLLEKSIKASLKKNASKMDISTRAHLEESVMRAEKALKASYRMG
ncbi:MAG: zinc-dependent metalloprotease [Planctomycetota bacterium]|nr:zinc-dependent metalloprotease [Planctomycetota bacterium]